MTTRRVAAALALVAALALCACGGRDGAGAAGSPRKSAVARINGAAFHPPKASGAGDAYDPMILKLQVLLDRARFSPGAIDGHTGDNVVHALSAYRQVNNIKGADGVDRVVWDHLTKADPRPVVRSYVIDADDVAGPFTPNIPADLAAMSRLEQLGYTSPVEELAEAFHMSAELLRALNPKADFRPGSTIIVADRGGDDLGEDVLRIVVDRVGHTVRAYGKEGRVLAVYPATVGSRARPAPAGRLQVETVAAQPNYDYQSERIALSGADRRAGEIAAGPNSPVGVVWIDLSNGTYGIHGGPRAAQVGEAADHGYVRLTNWDARELARAVKPGVPVVFE